MLQYKLKTMLIAAAVVAILIVAYKLERENRLWRNTRFHCEHDGVVTLPSGETFKTNIWTTTDLTKLLARLGTGVWKDGRELTYLVQFPGIKGVTKLTIAGKTENAVVIDGSEQRSTAGFAFREYWVIRESDMPHSDEKEPVPRTKR